MKEDEITKEIGKEVRRRREEKKWKAEYLANKIGISPGYLSKLENGKKPINLKNLRKFAEVFEITIPDLFPNKEVVFNPLTGEEDWFFVVQQLKDKGFSPGDVYLKFAQEAIEKDKSGN